MTARKKTTAASTAGSFAPETKAPPIGGLSVTDPAYDYGDWSATADIAMSVARGERIAMLFGDVDEDGTHVADTLTELLHYADANGWDFNALLDQAQGYYADVKADERAENRARR